ncbi:MAG: hypothetical protein H8D67_05735 [Deltaproteobacteria bacterium]|nr:hypothetical protein [Deltaproteobacteria bacterium]
MDTTTNYEHDPKIRTVRAKIQGFLDYVEGTFHVRDVYDALGARTVEEKAAIRKGLSREKGQTIESGGTYGVWHKIDKDIKWFDLSEIEQYALERLPAKFSLGLHHMIDFQDGDLIVIAGLSSSGKSGFELETGRKNLGSMKVNYLSSEVTLAGIHKKAQDNKPPIDLQSLKGLRFAMRTDNFQDLIEPGALNLIDYLSPPSLGDEPKYFAIPHLLSKIHQSLKGKGLAVVSLQKDPGKKSGEGGFKTYQKANLYLTLDRDEQGRFWANIEKCKVRPDLHRYRLQYEPQPFELIPLSDWMPPKGK